MKNSAVAHLAPGPRRLGPGTVLVAFLLLCPIAAAAESGAPAAPQVGAATQGARVQILNPWLRAAPPGSRVHAAYLELANPTTGGARLIGAVSEQASAVEIHTTLRDGDRLRMRRLRWIAVPPASAVQFASGGRHLMLFGLHPAPRVGEEVTIDLLFDDNSRRSVQFPVFRQAPTR